jgi:formate/nitrite transporter FocA (FNT family)
MNKIFKNQFIGGKNMAFHSSQRIAELAVEAGALAYGADDIGGKLLAIWFPIMAFVAIGFQHVVANMFVIPAAIFSGQVTWGNYVSNFVPVVIGNAIGGSVFVAIIYWTVHKGSLQSASKAKSSIKEAS